MEVSSPDGSRWETVEALVDTGASYSQVPGSILQRLGIFPTDTVEAELADERVVEDPIAEVRMRIYGLETFTWVTFGPENVAPLLGAHALKGVRMALDPLRRTLISTRFPTRISRMPRSSQRLTLHS